MGKPVDYRDHIDPEYRRWGSKYPRFPGVAECVRLLQTRKLRGAWRDIVFFELVANAQDCLPELIAAFRSEDNECVRLMVLSAITEARLAEAIPFLADVVRERHPQFASYAEQGLTEMGTREARTALWEAMHV